MKSILLIALLLISTHFSGAQNVQPEWHWAKNINSKRIVDIEADKDGNFFIIRHDLDSINYTTPKEFSYLTKYSASGHLEWEKVICEIPYATIFSIAIANNNDIVLAGELQGVLVISGDTLISNGSADALVLKLDESGNYLWGKHAGGIDWEAMGYFSVDVDDNDNIVIHGSFSGTANFDNQTIQTDIKGAFTAKYDKWGNLVWVKKADLTNTNSFPSAMCINKYGNVFVAGGIKDTAYFDNIIIPVSKGTDFYLAKYSSNGLLEWVKTSANVDIRSMTADWDGNIAMTGWCGPKAIFDNDTLVGSISTYLAKLDDQGNYLWVTSGGGGGHPDDIACDAEGSLYVSLYTSSYPTFDNKTFNTSEDMVVKYDASGKFIWGYMPDGPAIDRVAFGGNSIYICGKYENTMLFGPHSIVAPLYQYTFYVAKASMFNLGVKKMEGGNNVSLYPNPSDGVFHIEPKEDFSSMKVYDAVGKLIMSKPIIGKHQQIDISKNADGVYFIELQGEKGSMTKQVVLQK